VTRVENPKIEPNTGQSGVAQYDETLDELFGYHLKRAVNVLQLDLKAALKPFDLRMLTYTALVLIVDNPGLRQSQLADAMDVERPNMVVIIDTLESRELISRDRVLTDRRAYALHATLGGRRLCEKATIAVKDHEDRLLHELSPEMRQTVIAALKLIRKVGGGAVT
jgi:DNA-binding MarR family transcriptional regulator|tara:strand:+ start:100 stop:597 length:498 start_codon:yes stop_codon:yes gene_type:complete